MLFCSQGFLVFFGVVFVTYWLLLRRAWRVYFLLAVASTRIVMRRLANG